MAVEWLRSRALHGCSAFAVRAAHSAAPVARPSGGLARCGDHGGHRAQGRGAHQRLRGQVRRVGRTRHGRVAWSQQKKKGKGRLSRASCLGRAVPVRRLRLDQPLQGGRFNREKAVRLGYLEPPLSLCRRPSTELDETALRIPGSASEDSGALRERSSG